MGTANSWALQLGIPALNPMLPGMQVVKLIAGLDKRLLARYQQNLGKQAT